MNLLTAINKKIETLGKAEKVTKATLSELSRDLLQYVLIEGSHDIAAVNRCTAVLTPMNKATAVLFFTAFLPHKHDADTGMFGGLDKKAKDKKLELAKAFLADEANDIWSWAKDNVKIEAKEVDYLGKVTKAIQQAAEKGGATQLELVNAIVAGGLELSSLMALMRSAVPADKEAEAAMAVTVDVPAGMLGVNNPAIQDVC